LLKKVGEFGAGDRTACLFALAASGVACFDRPRLPGEAWRLRRGWPPRGDDDGDDHDGDDHDDGDGVNGDGEENDDGRDASDPSTSGGYDLPPPDLPFDLELCPSGNGLDTHRTWEALALGLLPVVAASPLASALASPTRSTDEARSTGDILSVDVPTTVAAAVAAAVTPEEDAASGPLKGAAGAGLGTGRFPLLVVPSWGDAEGAVRALPRCEARRLAAAPSARARSLLRLSVDWWADLARSVQHDARAEAAQSSDS